MSEHLRHTPETQPSAPEITLERRARPEADSSERAERLEQAHQAVAAETHNTVRPVIPQAPVDDRPQLIDNAVKMFRMHRNLSHIQNRLKPAQKSFSKLIHQPLVSRVSESAAKTVSRPSGMLGGGLVAFAGSLFYLFLAHRIGFTYNYFLFLIFFGGGFLLGVALEYAAYGLRRWRG